MAGGRVVGRGVVKGSRSISMHRARVGAHARARACRAPREAAHALLVGPARARAQRECGLARISGGAPAARMRRMVRKRRTHACDEHAGCTRGLCTRRPRIDCARLRRANVARTCSACAFRAGAGFARAACVRRACGARRAVVATLDVRSASSVPLGRVCSLKEIIESTKIAQCRGDSTLAHFIWWMIHYWPVNLWGHGPLLSI